MEKLSALKAERALAADQLQILSEAPADKFDAKAIDLIEKKVAQLNIQIGAIERSRNLNASLAKPVRGSNAVERPDEERLYVRYGKVSGAFEGPGGLERGYRVGQFCRAVLFDNDEAKVWCADHGIPLTKATGEGVNSAGGVLVPEEMMASIIVLRETYGVFRRECRVVPMGRDTLNWPRRTGGLTAYFVGEGNPIGQSNATFDNVQLTAKKIAALTKLSTEIADDAVINVADYIVNELAYSFAKMEDQCGFTGDGTSTYGGIRGLTTLGVASSTSAGAYTSASGHTTFGTLTAADITGLMGLLPQYALPNAKFYISQPGFAACFEQLIATLGGNRLDIIDGKIVYRYLGFPIVISQVLPTALTTLANKAMMFFGDLSLAAAMGERRGVTIKRLEERFADQDQIGIMGTERFDINVHDMGSSTLAGPLVTLIAAGS